MTPASIRAPPKVAVLAMQGVWTKSPGQAFYNDHEGISLLQIGN